MIRKPSGTSQDPVLAVPFHGIEGLQLFTEHLVFLYPRPRHDRGEEGLLHGILSTQHFQSADHSGTLWAF